MVIIVAITSCIKHQNRWRLSYCIFVHAMPCHLQRKFLPHITNDDSIAGVDYLKVKNDVIHCKTIISDRSLIHAAPNFLLLSG